MTPYLIGLCIGLLIMAPVIGLALYAGLIARKEGGMQRDFAGGFQPALRVVGGSAAR
ncbi:hypothetical protein Q4543_07910 [Salipiger sp. 1_MG-2023]|uniref:hypothetical protein n=1 Tax=Salipiger sp. 1_MG-2023 TaxID=3062665 RepID=UPI0026E33C40|nr:hypothetical protein [Salipiger sp. 1_MG-2023]MDO6585441.1 hypothetical protein [Salipiger sp. 1_MG-2023]